MDVFTMELWGTELVVMVRGEGDGETGTGTHVFIRRAMDPLPHDVGLVR